MKRVEEECAMFRLMPKTKKSEGITYNILLDHPPLRTTEGNAVKLVSNFKYLVPRSTHQSRI